MTKSRKGTAKRTDEPLWRAIVKEIREGSKGGPKGTWNARKAQMCVRIYIERGGGYIGERGNNSLAAVVLL